MKKYLLILLLALLPLSGWAQGKVYTKKLKLADFPLETTKVVLSGDGLYQAMLQSEFSRRWRISAFEFCTVDEYEAMKTDKRFYFLRTAADEQVAYLILDKGGKPDDKDQLQQGFEVIRIPIYALDNPGVEVEHLGAFIDILQQYMTDALDSDKVAYAGLGHYNSARAIRRSDPTTLVNLEIGPYEMVYSSETHELFRFRKSRKK